MNKQKELRALSGRLRIIGATLDPAEFKRPGDYEEVRRLLIGSANDISAKASRFAQWEGPMDLAEMGGEFGGGAPETAPPPAEPQAPEGQQQEPPGRYDPAREPLSPLWNITINRIKAPSYEEAHDIVKGMVDKLVSEGHTTAAVGDIRPSNDKTTPKSGR
jgi:hypothetical protein